MTETTAERGTTRPTRTALVTGAASGIGKAIAEQFAAEGVQVVALDRSESVHQIGATHSLVVDLSDRAEIDAALAELVAKGVEVDILVNCAGIQPQARDGGKNYVEDVTDEVWDLTFEVNLTAPFRLSRALVPGMKERGWGRIINIASRAGQTYVASTTVDYSATKAGLIGFTRMLAGEVSRYGVTVNAVAPGRVSTPLADAQAEDAIEAMVATIPAGRVGASSEVAAAVTFLASDPAAYITGATIAVNGGAHMP
ncbi:3-ketoacyl-ACP reductase [Microbacterium sp. CH12i]|uniref:SDR family NAD(P)-dependent oxidoreductase n=1 Tax=Microbacterium sp. CH12i TaxID=1479651 RepID=UPI0004612F84|nr:SDR family NAD(P)-dependent oxidoreductase [Microbacterium sp. CH12i]KDA05336.1 3-ketoacyl-ACP reductase [Microbacterium sp. CH12i]